MLGTRRYYRGRVLDDNKPSKRITRDGRSFIRVFYTSTGKGRPRSYDDVSEEEFRRNMLVVSPFGGAR